MDASLEVRPLVARSRTSHAIQYHATDVDLTYQKMVVARGCRSLGNWDRQ